ncbi:Eco57I restriction-modification methylase domain-containing protein [Dictyobacter formicarum]|uniref:Eco57I restriction-modification methylase domain-containing protein n=1 Tax=Dictyobacter formicarum TaxID=2778368 RepID=UPI001916C0D0|nr:DNA methyltransferase [Dictyobacter formicarum]
MRPTLAIKSPHEPKPRLLVQLYPKNQNLRKPVPGKAWNAYPETRMMELLRKNDVRLGLLTNGEHWMLVDAPAGETTGYYSWYASLWLEEKVTLRAFHSLLGMRRFFNVEEGKTIEALLAESASKQQEVTTQLGDQVRRAVEVLVQTLDRIDKDSGRDLLKDVPETQLYEAALTVMMRLVFLLSAEERKLLLLEDPTYDHNYAASTLHQQLREQADQQGEEVLGLRYDAWSRLLALFRIVYGGLTHENLSLPAYGGRLFDPDRFPFLEGRATDSSWRETPANPLRIDNRTVLYLLNALQYLQVPMGGVVEPRRLSFRGLDIEQIGHVYEGLLDHTVKRATATILGLQGSDKSEPELPLEELEQRAGKGEQVLLAYLKEVTGRGEPALKKGLELRLEKQQERSRLMEACDNQQEIFQRALPYAGLLRKDTFQNYTIITAGSVYMTHGSDRRDTGTHYTPRSLTEPIVQHALDPLVYIGPAEGWPEEQWQLRGAAEILSLTVCDIAMGSGAFLVQACRYLSEKLVEAWEKTDRELNINRVPTIPQHIPGGQLSQGAASEELIPLDREERLVIARRLVSERCIYGVDVNPMAVEMAKLSMWLITLAKGQPFTFLDHALRCGDSLLGVSDSQLENWSMDAEQKEFSQKDWIQTVIKNDLPKVTGLREQIRKLHEHDITGIEIKEKLLKEADQVMEIIKLGADLLIAIELSDTVNQKNLQMTLSDRYLLLMQAFNEGMFQSSHKEVREANNIEFKKLRSQVDVLLNKRRPFHWQLEFPEVFINEDEKNGFSAIMGNPPFQGGHLITGTLGTNYRDYMVRNLAKGKRGRADLCAYFFLRANKLTKNHGMNALVATNSISQGDTRKVGLEQIVKDDQKIVRTITNQTWQGDASIKVSYLWIRKGSWKGFCVLDNLPVPSISPFLAPSLKSQENPFKLINNTGKAFKGSFVLGMGFVLNPDEAKKLIERDEKNKEVIFPYLNGEDLNSRPDQSPSRWIINFYDWPLEKAENYSDCIEIVRKKVKPERDLLGLKSDASAKGYAKLWWQYGRKGIDLYSTIAGMKRIISIAFTSRTCAFTFINADITFSDATIVIAFENARYLSVLQSSIHLEWVFRYGSSLKGDQRYTPTDCFGTFPFPHTFENLESIGEQYYTYRQSIMHQRQEGLTKTYNRMHDPNEQAEDIVRLRELHKELDEAVARTYGWDDLKLEHGFHETKQGLRYTLSEAARQEVLDRLLLLNHQRHAEEVAAGLVDENGKPTAKCKKLLAKDAESQQGRAKKNGTGQDASGGQRSSGDEEEQPGQGRLFEL